MAKLVRKYLLGLCLLAGISGQGQAQFTPAVDYISVSQFTANQPLVVGYAFTVGVDPISVTSLGMNTANIPPGGNVRIYQDGTAINLAMVAITTESSVSGDGRYGFENLATPITLLPGIKYELVAEIPTGQQVFFSQSNFTADPSITVNGGILGTVPGGFPITDLGDVGPYFGPAFGITPVPEPMFVALAGFAFVGFTARRWRVGKSQSAMTA